MCKKFAEDTSKHEKLNGLFRENEAIPDIMTRNYELFKVNSMGGGGLVSPRQGNCRFFFCRILSIQVRAMSENRILRFVPC